MSLENQILEVLEKSNGLSLNTIKKRLMVSMDKLEKQLNSLQKESKIFYSPRKELYNRLYEGRLVVKDKGHAMLFSDNFENPLFVDARNINSAYTNDIVYFYKMKDSKNKDNLSEAVVNKIKTRSNEYVIGELKIKNDEKYFVKSFSNDFKVKAEIKTSKIGDAVVGNVCRVKILKYLPNNIVEGQIVEILGHKDDPGIDIKQIAAAYGFDLNFPEDVIEQLKTIPNEIDVNDYKHKKDYTNKVLFTIDGDDSKDFDDAVSLEILENGNYLLGVYIADVNEYVMENSPLDMEALKRGTSVYLASTVIPMLPHKLSNGICSLNEGVNRLVLACLMQLDSKGNLVDYEIEEGIIKSKYRLTYNNVNKMLDGDKEIITRYQDIYETILNMKKLSDIIRQKRVKRGGIEFETVEYKIKLDEEYSVKDIDVRERGRSEMIIEDFMLNANETVAYHLNIANLPCAYRIHEKPDYERVTTVFNLINNLGFNLKIPKNNVHGSNIQEAMKEIKESPQSLVINQLMLRSMMKAKYDERNLGHFGLAMKYYCHFTSPIRRYPDLIVHRVLKQCLFKPGNYESKVNHFSNIMSKICDVSSIQERKSIECEREVNDMLIADYMSNYTDHTFTGMITSMQGFGMFVTLKNGVEGLVHVKDMNGYYVFDEQTMKFVSTSDEYHLGQEVKVVCVKASKQDKKVGFILEEHYKSIEGF